LGDKRGFPSPALGCVYELRRAHLIVNPFMIQVQITHYLLSNHQQWISHLDNFAPFFWLHGIAVSRAPLRLFSSPHRD
jgi:hypothetical protein